MTIKPPLIAKVNIGTDLRGLHLHDSSSPARESLTLGTLKAATDAMQGICVARYEAFGAAGNVSRIKAKSPETMISSYS